MLRLLLVSGTMGLLIGLVLEFFTCSADMDADAAAAAAAAADDDDNAVNAAEAKKARQINAPGVG